MNCDITRNYDKHVIVYSLLRDSLTSVLRKEFTRGLNLPKSSGLSIHH